MSFAKPHPQAVLRVLRALCGSMLLFVGGCAAGPDAAMMLGWPPPPPWLEGTVLWRGSGSDIEGWRGTMSFQLAWEGDKATGVLTCEFWNMDGRDDCRSAKFDVELTRKGDEITGGGMGKVLEQEAEISLTGKIFTPKGYSKEAMALAYSCTAGYRAGNFVVWRFEGE